MNLQSELQGLAFLAIAFVLLYLAKLVQDAIVKSAFDADDQITEKSNFALALRRGGMYLGLAIGLRGALTGASKGFAQDIMIFALDGVLLVILLGVAKLVADKLILPNLSNSKEIGHGNVAVGAAEAGLFLATGLIAAGSFTGESRDLVAGLLGAAAFFALGQIALILSSVIVEWTARLDVKNEIAAGNASAGILIGSAMVALGIILGRAVSGPSLGWSQDLAAFGYETVKGLIVLFVFGKLADWIFLPKTDIAIETRRDKNAAAILLHSSVIISVALLAVTAVL